MFDLDREVRSWSAFVHADRCNSGASEAELRDHLYCEIDRARAEGMSDEQAFEAAISRIGAANELATEHSRDRSLLGTACASVARFERRNSRSPHRSLFVAHALVWASVMIATSMFTSKGAGSSSTAWVILSGQLACWYASEQILRRALRVRRGNGPN